MVEWITTYWMAPVDGGVMLGYPTIILIAWIGTSLVRRAFPSRFNNSK